MNERDDWHLTESLTHESGRGDPFAAAIRGTRMPMVITDPRQDDNPIVFANEAFQTLTGYARDEVVGRNCRFLQGPDTDPEALALLRRKLQEREAMNVDLLNYRKDGSSFWNALFISPVRAEDGEVQFFFASQLDCTERVEAQLVASRQKAEIEDEVRLRTVALQAALEAKTTLLHEVDHRVKNNLTMIGSLLRLQLRSLADPKLVGTLENMLARVDALAAVHRRLYESDDVRRFDLAAFVSSLVDDVVGASGRADIRVAKELRPVTVRANVASALGLIFNEIVTNAIKHAYADGRGGVLRLRVAEAAGQVSVTLRDDGPGFDFDAPPGRSMGRTLVARLSRQVGATTTWTSADPGTAVTIRCSGEGAGP